MTRRQFIKSLVGAGSVAAAAPLFPVAGMFSRVWTWIQGQFCAPKTLVVDGVITVEHITATATYMDTWAKVAAEELRNSFDRDMLESVLGDDYESTV